ncbi:MAG: cyclodeaminase/cyclohydrolase family protein [Candidatus Omnitrophica bacterium]|nr:cyclodeaminase/cyclohydrolase family protein [Candidatus Omnitrophota bacterium]
MSLRARGEAEARSKLVSSRWTIRRFLGRLGSAEPAPGGGSAAALASALGCAVAGKVCRLVLRRRRTPARARRGLRQVRSELARLSRRLEGLVGEDAAAYAALVRSQRIGHGAARARAAAAQCPLAICDCSVRALRCVKRLEPLAGRRLGSDLRAARALLKAGFEGAEIMAKINLRHP